MFRRANADSHLLLIIIGFVTSVLMIRAYLYVTGYPQIGGGGLHIAHMLWGGIALFASATVLLLYRSLFLSRVVAFVTGVGWGFFIDEVGKFITESNDYFFAPAAVIIYVLFLIIATIYLVFFRQKKHEPKTTDNEAFSDIRELMDGVTAGQLTHRERELLMLRIERLKSDDEKRYRDLGQAFETFVLSQPISLRQLRLEQIGELLSRVVERAAQGRWFRLTIIALLTVDVLVGVTTLSGIPGLREPLFASASEVPLAVTHGTITIVRLITEALIILGLYLAERSRVVFGRRLMIGSLLVMIIGLDSVDFYVSQFTAAYSVLLDVTLLALIEARYGNQRLHPERHTS